MSRKKGIIYEIIADLFAIVLLFVALFFSDIGGLSLTCVVFIVLGVIAFGIFGSFFHELGHVVFAKANDFFIQSVSIFFVKAYKEGEKLKFKFDFHFSAAGSTEVIPKKNEKLSERFIRVTLGGCFFNLFFSIISILPIVFGQYLSTNLYCFFVAALPISFYFFLDNLLPKVSGGVRNDGAVAYGIRKKDDVSIVTLAVLSIHSDLFVGKRPSDIEENKLFNLPQICEEEPSFAALLDLRYWYYLDREDYVMAEKINQRLIGLTEDAPPAVKNEILRETLYAACTYSFNEDRADELTYELENFLNNDNSAQNIRTKLAYLIFVKKERESARMFFDKLYREIDKISIKGLAVAERSIADRMFDEFKTLENAEISE